MARDLAVILGDIIRKGRCPEVLVVYTCGHTCQAEVQLAKFLEKRDPRTAARTLRVACRSGEHLGEEGTFKVEVPGGPCRHSACASSSSAGRRTQLRCGATDMDLSTCEAPEDPIPVGIAYVQFATWVQSSNEEPQHIKLITCKGTQTWRQFFTTPGSLGPVLIGMALWLLLCILYAVYATPANIMVSPETFYKQVQDQIEKIPVPKDSPHYSHYRRYYLQQYQQHLTQYREMEEDWKLNRGPRLHSGALLQGLGLGTWFFVAVLALCEWKYTTVTTWINSVEEHWAAWRRSRNEAGQKKKRKKAEEPKEKAKPKELKSKEAEKRKPKRKAEDATVPRQTCDSAQGSSRSLWSWFARERDDVSTHKEAVEPDEAKEGHEPEAPKARAAKAEEEPAVEPEPVCENPVQEQAEEDGQEQEEDDQEEEEEEEEEKEEEDGKEEQAEDQQASDSEKGAHAEAEEKHESDDGSWQMVTKGRLKAAPSAQKPPEPVPAEPDEPIVQVPKHPETLSTQELVDLLQTSSVRRQLLRRGVPIREQLLHWFRELQEPPSKLMPVQQPASAASKAQRPGPAGAGPRPDRPKATPAPWSKLERKGMEVKVPLRAEA
ncbi:unnamed protein product, partial [Effrenium voratum]